MGLITIPIAETVDLNHGTKTVTLPYPLIRGDNDAHELVLTLVSGANPVVLTGVTAKCYAVLPDMVSTAIADGTVNGNVVRATFNEAFYVKNGHVDIIMRIQFGGATVVPLRIIATVQGGTTDTFVDPTHVVPSLDDLFAKIDACEKAAAKANAAATEANAAKNTVLASEGDRQTNERNRQTAETDRSNSEQSRVKNENVRILTESARNKKLGNLSFGVSMIAPSANPSATTTQDADSIDVMLNIPTSNLAYATFEIDDNGDLYMISPDGFNDIGFKIDDADDELYVIIGK